MWYRLRDNFENTSLEPVLGFNWTVGRILIAGYVRKCGCWNYDNISKFVLKIVIVKKYLNNALHLCFSLIKLIN